MRPRYFLPSDQCVVRNVIDRQAKERGDDVFLVLEDGTSHDYQDFRRVVRTYAAAFQSVGVGHGDFVLVWLSNELPGFVTAFALNYLGAIFVPINTAYRGRLLEHVIKDSGARIMIADAKYLSRLPKGQTGHLETILVVNPDGDADRPGCCDFGEILQSAPMLEEPTTAVEPWHIQTVIYTSGTTGPSKGVLIPYAQVHQTYLASLPSRWTGRIFLPLPLFHMAGAGIAWATAMMGGTVVLATSFKTDAFWKAVNRFAVTHTILLGAMTPFLLKAEPTEADKTHTLRSVDMVPLSAESVTFAQRFNVDVYTAFNMTEISTPLQSGANPTKPGTCGRPRAGVEIRLVDDNDCEVRPSQSGELLVRTEQPWTMNAGYHGNPAATAAAWRNGWFHTGDIFRRDEDGDFFFIDRHKDALRRRGENISSFEVERELNTHPAIRESAVLGVPSEFGEDDVLAVIEPVPGMTVSPADIIDYMTGRVAHFMVPRYIRLVDSLPRTPTEKVEKHRLRQEGVTASCWDASANGVRVRRTMYPHAPQVS